MVTTPMQATPANNPLPGFAAVTPPECQPACDVGQKPDQPKPAASRHSGATGSGPSLQDPDLVDRIFDYILSEPSMAKAVQAMAQASKTGQGSSKPGKATVQQIKDAVRKEFAGERCYIPSRTPTDRQQLVADVLRLFNGRNATEVARRLQISRASVYSYIKQARASK